jgi:hypothetical protein
MASAVTPGADAVSPVCFAVSLVQNAVFDVNGDDAGSGVTRGVAAAGVVVVLVGAAVGLLELLLHAPRPMTESTSVNVNDFTGAYRGRMVIPRVSAATPEASHDARDFTSA